MMSVKLASCKKWRKNKAAKMIEKTKTIGGNMVALAEYLPEEVLPFVAPEMGRMGFNVGGHVYRPRIESLRLQTFQKSAICVGCGVQGTIMRLEYSANCTIVAPHFNLYHVRADGIAVLMTQDHIIPRSNGGKDWIGNLQTMCCICNVKKGSSVLC